MVGKFILQSGLGLGLSELYFFHKPDHHTLPDDYFSLSNELPGILEHMKISLGKKCEI